MKKILVLLLGIFVLAGLGLTRKGVKKEIKPSTYVEILPVNTTGGYAMLRQRCFICHASAFKEGMNHKDMQAPPMPAVKMHYLRRYPQKEDFIRAVRQWVKKPTVEKSLMPGARKKFGLMPAFPYPDEDLEKMAAVIYDRIPIPQGRHERNPQHHERCGSGQCGGGKCGNGH